METEHLREAPSRHASRSEELGRRVKFVRDDTFYIEVRRRVDEFCKSTGRRPRDCPRMYLKSAILLTVLAGSWAFSCFLPMPGGKHCCWQCWSVSQLRLSASTFSTTVHTRRILTMP